jgi:hypothetical protein
VIKRSRFKELVPYAHSHIIISSSMKEKGNDFTIFLMLATNKLEDLIKKEVLR